MQSSSQLLIDLATIQNNLNLLTAQCGNVMIMVKANAYGTDPVLLSKFIQKGNWSNIAFIGVSHVSEGIQLREAGIVLPIFVIAAPSYEAELVVNYGLTAAVSSLQEVKCLNQAAKKCDKKIPVHMHLNTGLNRFGASKKEAISLHQAITQATHLDFEGLMTHFVAAESSAFDEFSQEQITQFKDFLDILPCYPRWIHAANSAGAVRFRLPFCNLARIGLGVMGYGECFKDVRPALSLTTRLAGINIAEQGETVGYKRTFTIQKQRAKIGVIPIGYHDGLHRSISGQGYVFIHGKKAPMIGTICMDFMMIDISDIPEAEVGDEVVIFGSQLSPEILANWAKTDVKEILVNLPRRVKRLWK